MKIKKMMYELYKIDWMEHHVSLSRQKESVKEYFCGETSFDSYENYLFERGFQGEMYASLEEFLNNEYLDENIIDALLDVDSKSSFNEEILAEYQKDLAYSKIVHVESSIKNLEDLVKGCDFAVPICDNLVGKEFYDFSRMIPKVLYDTDGIFYNKDTGALYYVSESEITEVEVVKVVDADDYAEEFSKPVPNHYFCGEADDCSCFAYFAKKEKKGDLWNDGLTPQTEIILVLMDEQEHEYKYPYPVVAVDIDEMSLDGDRTAIFKTSEPISDTFVARISTTFHGIDLEMEIAEELNIQWVESIFYEDGSIITPEMFKSK